MKAILSVFDKEGLAAFARGLSDSGVDLYSTGGTKRAIEDAGVPVKSISDLTGSPEILDGRVKTLHPKVHGGILALRDNPQHLEELAANEIEAIDIVVSNLYPFVETAGKAGVTLAEALENIDIGGPTLVRASAKNFPSVLVVVDPRDYATVLDGLRSGGVAMEDRRRLARKAFQHVALYDTAIATYLRGEEDPLTDQLTIGLEKVQRLRYGENPHQQSAFYREALAPPGTIASAVQLHGKELSHNNILDADAAWNVVRDFANPAVAVVKHTNPCGLASNEDLTEAYRLAYEGDPVSAFGGIVACNRPLDLAAAESIAAIFYEIVIAPSYEPDALARLKRKRDLRILQVEDSGRGGAVLDYRRVSGGMLVQTADRLQGGPEAWKTVTERSPTPAELEDLAFAWKAVKHVKSNAIVLARGGALIGMGAGQPNRVTSVHLALRAAGEKAAGCVLGSDAFFPFPDGVEMAAQGGATAIAQPGGSVRDSEVIEAANKAGLAMVFTGARHFKH